MNEYLDMWNLMSYDYSGSVCFLVHFLPGHLEAFPFKYANISQWDNTTGMNANLYNSTQYANSTPFNTDQAVEYYLSNGATGSKINLGIPLYGRSFTNTDGPGTNFSGVGNGSWQDGIWDYKALPQAGAKIYYDNSSVASWSYDSSQRLMISYDTPSIVQVKGDYIKSKGLGGGMYWDTSSDKTGPDSLLTTVCSYFLILYFASSSVFTVLTKSC